MSGSALLHTISFMALVVSVFRLGVAFGPWAVDETGETRPLVERHGFWVVTVGTLLYLPMAGNYSLSDPWETHYGEVAREMLARNDWISTWWAQEGWFLSKPVLDFWMQVAGHTLLLLSFGFLIFTAATSSSRGWLVRFLSPAEKLLEGLSLNAAFSQLLRRA